ncbi:CbrC family protein [Streptomyces sp. 900105245]
MGFAIRVHKFREGDIVPVDASVVREVLEPYAPYDVPDGEAVEWVRAADGSEADVYLDHGVTFDRPGPGVLYPIAEVARRTRAAVLLLGDPAAAIVTCEEDRAHLPEDLRGTAVVAPSSVLTGATIQQVIRPLPEPRPRPALPPFPYHPDPVATGSVIAAAETCVCCGHDQGWICTGPVYGADVPDGRVCPYCVAFGTAAERCGAFFNEVEVRRIPDDAVRRIRERTPNFATWQDWDWPAHCGDGGVFLGAVGAEELRSHPQALDHLRRQCAEWGWGTERTEGFVGALDKDGGPTGYLFRCRVCDTPFAHADFT